MTDIEDRLRALSSTPVEPPSPTAALHRRVGRRRARRARAGAGVVAALLCVSVIAIWPDADDGRTVRTVDRPTPSTIVTTGPGLDQDDANAARSVVTGFLHAMKDDDLEQAASLWSGYPDDAVDKAEALEPFRSLGGLFGVGTRLFALPSAGFEVLPIVTVVSAPDQGAPRAAAFVVGQPRQVENLSDRPLIERVPGAADGADPPPGTLVAPGDRISVPGVPVEGGARAFIDDREVDAVVDLATNTTGITVPDHVQDAFVLTVSMASPELPTASAYLVCGRARRVNVDGPHARQRPGGGRGLRTRTGQLPRDAPRPCTVRLTRTSADFFRRPPATGSSTIDRPMTCSRSASSMAVLPSPDHQVSPRPTEPSFWSMTMTTSP